MPKIIRRTEEAEASLTPLERQVKYLSLKKAEGKQTQMRIWVPTTAVPWVRQLARDMRAVSSQGLDPLTAYKHTPAARKLPEGLLKVPS